MFPAATRPTDRTGRRLRPARSYAEQNKSSAFIVWRNGRVEDEAYFGGATRDTPIVSKSLAKPITAFAVGTRDCARQDPLGRPAGRRTSSRNGAASRRRR
jgi:hypothetical protein